MYQTISNYKELVPTRSVTNCVQNVAKAVNKEPESLFSLGFFLFISFFFYVINNKIIYDIMNSDMMVLPRKGAKSPLSYIFGASAEANRRAEQTYCLALLRTYL